MAHTHSSAKNRFSEANLETAATPEKTPEQLCREFILKVQLTGDINAAIAHTEINYYTYTYWRKKQPNFATQVDHAKQAFIESKANQLTGLIQRTGDIETSRQNTGISVSQYKRWLKDPDFAHRVRAALLYFRMNVDSPKTVGDRIYSIRELHGLSQSDFGKPIGLSKDQVYDLEVGQREARVSELAAIAYEYRCSVLYLIYGNQQPQRGN